MANETKTEAAEVAARGGEAEATIWSRRDFFSLAGWAGILSVVGASLIAFGRFMFPRVLFEPSPVFKAGKPDEYPPGGVSERFKQSERVWIVRNDDGSFYAILAICTHLGCTPNWLPQENKFKCPCHGSGYYRSGQNFEGPTPRPMDRVKITLTPDGELVVDKGAIYHMDPGDPDEEHPESILKV